MPTQLRHELTSRGASGSVSERAAAEAVFAERLRAERAGSIAATLVQLAERHEWTQLERILVHLGELPETRGAILMRALNVAPPGRAHRLLPYLIFHGAPADLVQRVIALGAVPQGELRLQEHATAQPITVSYLHLAALKNRFDIAQLLLREGHASTALNSLGESAPEQFARSARRADLRSEAVVLKLGSLVRKMLIEGVGPLHLAQLIEILSERRAWTAAETVIDECTLGPERVPEARIPRGQLSELVWKVAQQECPAALFGSLRALQRSGHLSGAWTVPLDVPPNFLIECLPSWQRVAGGAEFAWHPLEARLRSLELAAEFTHPDFVAALVNATCHDRLLSARLTDELVILGIEDPPTLQGHWTLAHALISDAAPLPVLERFVRLRPDLSVNAFIQDNGEVACDGTPLHLACALQRPEHIALLIRAGAPLDSHNHHGEIPLQTFFVANGGRLRSQQASVVADFLRAGSPVENRSAAGVELGEQSIAGVAFRRLLSLSQEYAQQLAAGKIQSQPPTVVQRHLIDDGAQLLEVDELHLRSLIVPRLRKFLREPTAHRLAQMSLTELLAIDAVRSVIETLHASRTPAEVEPERFDADPADAEWPEESPAEEQDSEWLQFPDFSADSFDTQSDEDEDDLFAIADEGDDEPAEINQPGPSALSDTTDLPAPPAEPELDFAPPTDLDITEDLSGSEYFLFGDQNSYYRAAARFLDEGSPHEAYLLLEALEEATATAPTRLNATTRALRTLLFRAPPGVAQRLGVLLDHSGEHRIDGSHPYMAEYLCLLNHPFDKRKDVHTIGGLSLGISSVALLAQFGSLRGDLLHEFGRIGALNFSFPFWRFDAQPIQLGADSTTLFEQAGMERRENPSTTHWQDPTTGKTEHLWGPIFTVAPGGLFHDLFDNDEARQLGYAPLSRHTSVVWRRAGIFVGTDDGVLLCRNSSLLFGRDRFEHPGMVCSTPLSVQEIVDLRPEDISQRFRSITSSEYFNELQRGGRRSVVGDGFARAAAQLKHFNDQFQTIRVQYGRMKFDTHLETAWSQDGQQLRGGYRSPLFSAVVDQLTDRFSRRAPGGNSAIEFLAVANPDYPPYAPHATLPINERSLGVLGLLAAGRESQVSSRQSRESGVEDFLNVAFSRGRNSELFLMPTREGTH